MKEDSGAQALDSAPDRLRQEGHLSSGVWRWPGQHRDSHLVKDKAEYGGSAYTEDTQEAETGS